VDEFIKKISTLMLLDFKEVRLEKSYFEMFNLESEDVKMKLFNNGTDDYLKTLKDKTKYHNLYEITVLLIQHLINTDEHTEGNYNFVERKYINIENTNLDKKSIDKIIQGASIYENSIKDFREFDDYEHYISANTTLVVGNTENNAIPYVLDEEILLNSIIFYFWKPPNKNTSDLEILELKRDMINFKMKFYEKYNSLTATKKIMDYTYEEILDVKSKFSILDDLSEIEYRIREMESNVTKEKIEWMITIFSIIFSSGTIVEYIWTPIYLAWICPLANEVPAHKVFLLFTSTAALLFIIVQVLKKHISKRLENK